MKALFSTLFALIAMLIITGCNKTEETGPVGDLSGAVFIVNEGPFQNGTGSVMALNRETDTISSDLFELANGYPLGNIVQSMTIFKSYAYIVVNNANKVEVVRKDDFTEVARIVGLVSPRYLLGIEDNTALISCWDNKVKYVSLVDFSITDSVQVGTGPDEMVKSGGRIFVLNSGGYDIDSTVSVFNYLAPHQETKILVGYHPAGIQEDMNGNIWILCGGKGWNGFPGPGDTPAKLVCLDPDNLQILKEIEFPDSDKHPDYLVINKTGNTLYYNMPDGIYSFQISSDEINSQPFIASGIMFYAMGFDNKEDIIYASDPMDYTQNGYVYLYNASNGTAIDTIMAGVVPGGFCFSE
jgi:hypothetical protein